VSAVESEAMQAEFGTLAAWTEQAVRALGPAYAIPAGCRGSGSEGVLRWLAHGLALRPGARMLDDGAGLGGPAGWLARARDVRPVCAEPMADAVAASRRLFGLAGVVAAAQSLPFADGAFDTAWCLGVLCTLDEKAAALAELRRVLADGGGLGLLVFVVDRPLTPPLPEGNAFPSSGELERLLDGAGLGLTATATADLRDSPPEWDERADAVDAEIARRHGRDPRLRQAREQADRVGRLLGDGALRPWLGLAVAR
jgi:SAM-dependent methyltransferase